MMDWHSGTAVGINGIAEFCRHCSLKKSGQIDEAASACGRKCGELVQGGNESKKCDLLEHYIVRSPYALRAETATIPPRWAVSATVFTVHPLVGLISHVLSSPPYSHPIAFTQPLGHGILFLPLYLRPMVLF